MSTWTNADGIEVVFGTARSALAENGTAIGYQTKTLVVDLDSQNLPALADAVSEKESSLPANALITEAYLVATSAWVGTGTLTVGLGYDNAGTPTAVDADGIDAAVDVDTVLAATGDVVACDGALVDKTATIGANRAWVYAVATGTVSAGTGKLYLTYIEVV